MKTEPRSAPLRRSVIDVGQLAQRRTVLAEAQRGIVRSHRLPLSGGADLAAPRIERGPDRRGAGSRDDDR